MDGLALSFLKHAQSCAPKEGTKAMKRLICAALALSMLGATAAAAQPYHRGGYGYAGGWHRHDNTGALIGLGLGLFALGAIAAASDRDRYYDRYEYGPPPPPPPTYYGPAYYGPVYRY
jgi:hypothetical protein